MPTTNDLFISYASTDQALAVKVCALLEAQGIACWIAPRDVAPGAKWDEALLHAIDESGAFLLLLSAASNDSPFVQNEVNRAFGKKKAIFTLRIEDVPPSGSLEFYLARHHWTDGFSVPLEDATARVAVAIGSLPGAPIAAAGMVPGTVAAPTRARTAVRRGRADGRIAVAVALVAGLAAGVVIERYLVARPGEVRAGEAEQRTEFVTPSTPDPNSFAISPDGRQVVFAAFSDGVSQLWLRSLANTAAQRLPDTARAAYPFWAPDGRSIAFFADGTLKRFDLGATRSTVLTSVVGMRGGAWTSDGTIVFSRGTVGPLYRMPASGGVPTPASVLDTGQSNHRFPQFLPDGRRFLFFAMGTPETQGIYLGSLDSPVHTRVTLSASAGSYLAGGWLVWVREGVLVAQRLDDQPRLVGDPVVVADQLTYDGTTFVPGVSTSSTGAMLYRAAGGVSRELRWFDQRGKELEALSLPDEYLINPRLSPDGGRALAFRTVDGNSDIWLYDSVRISRITTGPASEQFAIWSRDGRRIVFRSNRTGVYDLYAAESSSPGSEKPLLTSPRDKVANDFSPDGRYLTFQENDPRTDTAWNLWAWPVDGSRMPFALLETKADERGAVFSPDGRWLAYSSNQSGRYEAYVRRFTVPAEGGPAGGDAAQWQVSTTGGALPKWRADGRAIYYQGLEGQLMTVPVSMAGSDVQVGAPVAIFRPSVFGAGSDLNLGRQWDVAPDGRFLVNVVRNVTTSLVLIQHWVPPSTAAN